MSTKSILKNIHIQKKEQTQALAVALEHAVKKESKTVILGYSYEEIQGDIIKSIFS